MSLFLITKAGIVGASNLSLFSFGVNSVGTKRVPQVQ